MEERTFESLKVVARVRPPVDGQRGDAISVSGDGKLLIRGTSTVELHCDAAFSPNASQREVYDSIKDRLMETVKGKSATVLMQGASKTGKTFTLFGTQNHPGILARAAKDIFQCASTTPGREFKIMGTFVEILGNEVEDMFRPWGSSNDAPISVREDHNGVHLAGSSTLDVEFGSGEEFLTRLDGALRLLRRTSKKRGGQEGHRVVMLRFVSFPSHGGAGIPFRSQLTFVDVSSGRKDGFDESVSSLEYVLHSLADPSSTHVPYQNSKLTRVVQNQFGGNAGILVLSCVSPCPEHASESLSRIQQALQWKKIRTMVWRQLIEHPLVEKQDVVPVQVHTALVSKHRDLRQRLQQAEEQSRALAFLRQQDEIRHHHREEQWKMRVRMAEQQVESLESKQNVYELRMQITQEQSSLVKRSHGSAMEHMRALFAAREDQWKKALSRETLERQSAEDSLEAFEKQVVDGAHCVDLLSDRVQELAKELKASMEEIKSAKARHEEEIKEYASQLNNLASEWKKKVEAAKAGAQEEVVQLSARLETLESERQVQDEKLANAEKQINARLQVMVDRSKETEHRLREELRSMAEALEDAQLAKQKEQRAKSRHEKTIQRNNEELEDLREQIKRLRSASRKKRENEAILQAAEGKISTDDTATPPSKRTCVVNTAKKKELETLYPALRGRVKKSEDGEVGKENQVQGMKKTRKLFDARAASFGGLLDSPGVYPVSRTKRLQGGDAQAVKSTGQFLNRILDDLRLPKQ